MGMFAYVTGFRDTKEHEKHVRVLAFCKKEGVSTPRETAAYFGDDSEDINPRAWGEDEIEEKLDTDLEDCLTKDVSHEMQERWEIDVKKIPNDVSRIRFTISY